MASIQQWPIAVRDGVAVVSMVSNKSNAINGNFVSQLDEALKRLKTDPELNKLPVVITGQGSYFSSGFDLKEFANGRIGAVEGLFDLMLGMLTFPRPLIAAGVYILLALRLSSQIRAPPVFDLQMNGHCVAAGFFVALSCDQMVAAEGAYKFALTEVLMGIPFPGLGMEMLRAKLPQHVATSLALFGTKMSPQQALAAGVVQAVVPQEKLIDAAVQAAKRIPPNAHEAFGIIKKYFLGSLLAKMNDPEVIKYEDIFRGALLAKQKEIVEYMKVSLGGSTVQPKL